jgi:ABC-2 type transport system ATP-binding protein
MRFQSHPYDVPHAIVAEDLWRSFLTKGPLGSRRGAQIDALKGVSLTVNRREIFGLLGQNGAGKTTLIKILTTLLAPTRGRALVMGMDVITDAARVRKVINLVSGGEVSGYGLLTVRENLWMFSQFYGVPNKVANRRIDELLEMVGLAERCNTKVRELSTGLRQKANLVRGLVSDPLVLFLDEPTLGLDVQTSKDVRCFVKQWVKESEMGKTVLLTTHYMAEADEICDRVAIIHEGKILAVGTPGELKAIASGGSRWKLVLEGGSADLGFISSFRGTLSVAQERRDGRTCLDIILQEDRAIMGTLSALSDRGWEVRSVEKVEPTLEDVFLLLTGASAGEGVRS